MSARGTTVPNTAGPEPTGLGRFGDFGGRFVPETLVPALEELEAEFRTADQRVACGGGTDERFNVP